MTTRRQLALSLIVVLLAASFVILRLRAGSGEQLAVEDSGHDHAAMTAGSGEQSPVVLDIDGARRIGVTFATVERRALPAGVRTVGTVAYDETRLATVSPKIDGWVERLAVDFTGAPITEGEPLMEVYSPALVSAQEELVLAARLVRDAAEGRAMDNALELLESSRRRLEYWDIPADEIRRLEESGQPDRTLTLRAPATGIVVEKNVVEGDRIVPGMTVYRIADLTRIWVEAEVFEKDLALVGVGQRAVVTFEAYPGRSFVGTATYVHPTVSVQSRTARVRLELPNPDLALKPGMYAQVELESLATPETLVVPRSALIQTGERALVFVLDAEGALLPREVEPGRTSGRLASILSGVEAGERVVSSAAFLVDAESNLGTMTGMDTMAPDGRMVPPDTTDGATSDAHQGHGG